MMRDPELEMAVDELCILNTNRDPTEKEMYDIYCWIDHLVFSRPKRNISRDFCDGVLVAELISTYLPRFVELRNYYPGLSRKNKANNWEHLNLKVFSKLGYKLGKQQMNDIMESTPGAIEKILFQLRTLIARKNRSILNYRVGMKPELPDTAPKAPLIPSAMTYSTAIKRRERSLSSQPRMPQRKVASNSMIMSTPIKPRSRPATVINKLPLRNEPRIMIAGKTVLPSNIKMVTVVPIARPVTANPSPSPKLQQQNSSPSPKNAAKFPAPRTPRKASKSKSPHPKSNNDSTMKSIGQGQTKQIVQKGPPQSLKRVAPIPQPVQKIEVEPVPKTPEIPPASKSVPEIQALESLSPEPEQEPEVPDSPPHELSPDLVSEYLTKFELSPEVRKHILPETEVFPEPEVFQQKYVFQEAKILPFLPEPEVLSEPEVRPEPELLPEPEVFQEPEVLPEYIPESDPIEEPPSASIKIVEITEEETIPEQVDVDIESPIKKEEEVADSPIYHKTLSTKSVRSFEVFGEEVFLSKISATKFIKPRGAVGGADNDKGRKTPMDEMPAAKREFYYGLV